MKHGAPVTPLPRRATRTRWGSRRPRHSAGRTASLATAHELEVSAQGWCSVRVTHKAQYVQQFVAAVMHAYWLPGSTDVCMKKSHASPPDMVAPTVSTFLLTPWQVASSCRSAPLQHQGVTCSQRFTCAVIVVRPPSDSSMPPWFPAAYTTSVSGLSTTNLAPNDTKQL